jgi:hypothetical protein
VHINAGAKSGLNDAFIIDTETKKRLCAEDPKSAGIIKPVIRGRDIKKYAYKWDDLWMITTFPARKIDIENYPAVKKYLLGYGKHLLEQKGLKYPNGTKSRKKTNNKWFETQDQICCYRSFEKDKIIWADISTINPFALLEGLMYTDISAYILTSDTVNLKYLIACLNSKITFFEFRTISNSLDKAFRWTKQYIEQIHVPIITAANQHIADQMIALVEQITAIKKTNTKANTSDLEGQIDRLVYQLYDLTEDEIAIIER